MSTTAVAPALAARFVIACTLTGVLWMSTTASTAQNSLLQLGWSIKNAWSSGAVVLAATLHWRR
jgi:hypothetical protein